MTMVDDLVGEVAELLGQPGERVRSAAGTGSFLELGGDSMLALRLVARAHAAHGVALRLGDLLGPRPLREVITEARPHEVGAAPSDGRPAVREPTDVQVAMLASEDLYGPSATRVIVTARIEGAVDPDRLAAAVAAVSLRHPTLRSYFPRTASGWELRESAVPLPLDHLAMPCRAEDIGLAVDAIVDSVGRQPLPTATAPPIRILLVTAGAAACLVVAVHHALVDGWSFGILIQEIFDVYAGSAEPLIAVLPPAPLPPAERARQLAFWRAAIGPAPPRLALPRPDSAGTAGSVRGTRLPFALPEATWAAVARTAHRLHITPFSVLLAAYGVTLSRYSGQSRLLIGIPVIPEGIVDRSAATTPLARVIPVAFEVTTGVPVDGYLGRVARAVTDSLNHAQVPLANITAELGIRPDPTGPSLVQAAMGMHDRLLTDRVSAGGLTVAIEERHAGGAMWDLALFIQHSGAGATGVLEYRFERLSSDLAVRLLDSFVAAVAEVTTGGDRDLAEVRAIGPAARALLPQLTGPAQRPRTLDALVYRHREDEAVAVADPTTGERITYAELCREADAVAALLAGHGARPGAAVVLAVPRSVGEIVLLLGILRAGATYVAVDARDPDARLSDVVGRVRPAVIVTRAADIDRLRGRAPAGTPVVSVDELRARSTVDATPVDVQEDPERAAYIAFTSGSTGHPKGVVVSHRSFGRLLTHDTCFRFAPDTRMLRLSPLTFDASYIEVWGPLAAGGTVVVCPPGIPTPVELAEVLCAHRVNTLFLPPGLLRLAAEFALDGFAGVRSLLSGGDVVPAAAVRRILAAHPGLAVHNCYGPTENGSVSTTLSLTDASQVREPLPIGTAVPSSTAYVLDADGRLLPPGAVGELYVGGAGLAEGYLGDAGQTARAFGEFSPDLPGQRLYRTGDRARINDEATIDFHGRVDDQLKVRGHRVEPQEIVAVLLRHPAVATAYVFGLGEHESTRLVAAVVVRPGRAGDGLRDDLARNLNHYMRPTVWLFLDAMPVTATGKIDRARLAELALGEAPAQPAATGTAGSGTGTATRLGPETSNMDSARIGERIRATLLEVLELDGIDDEDNFFDVGGNSLLMIRVLARVHEEFSVTVAASEFLVDPTGRTLTRLVGARLRAPGERFGATASRGAT